MRRKNAEKKLALAVARLLIRQGLVSGSHRPRDLADRIMEPIVRHVRHFRRLAAASHVIALFAETHPTGDPPK